MADTKQASPAETELKAKAKKLRKAKAPAQAASKPKAAKAQPEATKPGVGGVAVGETPPLRELHLMAMETSRALARDTNGNARQRANRLRRAKSL